MGVAVASSGSPDKIAHNLGSSGLAPLFPDPHLARAAAAGWVAWARLLLASQLNMHCRCCCYLTILPADSLN